MVKPGIVVDDDSLRSARCDENRVMKITIAAEKWQRRGINLLYIFYTLALRSRSGVPPVGRDAEIPRDDAFSAQGIQLCGRRRRDVPVGHRDVAMDTGEETRRRRAVVSIALVLAKLFSAPTNRAVKSASPAFGRASLIRIVEDDKATLSSNR